MRDTERREDDATLTESKSDNSDCVVVRKTEMRKPLDPEAGEFVFAALDCVLEGISGDTDTPEHKFEMKLLDGDRDKKTEVADEESDEGERDEDRNKMSDL